MEPEPEPVAPVLHIWEPVPEPPVPVPKPDSLEAIVREAWSAEVQSTDSDRVLRDKFKQAKLKIKEWSKECFGSLDKYCSRLETKEELGGWRDRDRDRWLERRKAWMDLEEKKRSMLSQKAKLKWLMEGEDNTKFFHAAIKNRERKNAVRGLEINDEWVDDLEQVKAHVFDFFKGKFFCTSEEKPTFNSSKTIRISEEEANLLEAPLEEDEVWHAIRDCGSNKSPGPAGGGEGACTKTQKIIGKVISEPQCAFIKGRNILDGVLIANEAVNFVRNKGRKGLIFKVDFEKAYDTVDWDFLLETMKRMGFGKKWIGWIFACLSSSSMSVLVNGSPSKEFSMGRGLRQGDPMVSFLFVRIACQQPNELAKKNEKKYKSFVFGADGRADGSAPVVPTSAPICSKWSVRGLRPGLDALAVGLRPKNCRGLVWAQCVAENLYLLLEEAKDKGLFEGLLIGNDGIKISHLQFADDAIFFGKWSPRNLRNLIKILDCFRAISGLRINMRKSKIFGLGVQDSEVQNWARGVGCVGGSLPFMYLGLLVGAPMHRLSTWSSVVEKVRSKLTSWKARIISFGGRHTLVKSVLRSVPLYFLSLFRAPSGVIGELQNLERRLDGWKPCRGKKDSWEWEFDKNKSFSVQKLREILVDLEEVGVGGRETVWLSIVPKKVNVFLWRLRLGRIPTRVALDNMGIDLDLCLCPRCGLEVEDLDHTLLKCGEVKLLWSRVGKWWNKSLTGIDSVAQLLQEDADLVRIYKGKAWWVGVKWVFLYLLWSHRNRLVFHNDKKRLDECFYEWQRIVFK
ncbi:hypothetical protein OSB04_001127 [Centaurea solstitialis]|uniref:Reverse transcriptase domain-containing protein n=1 Tax=Centaurea solstitialis TaxID=347529 RepID=A0AA38WUT9_9ASTR|nr:hypothetical protein OSB04_001127 [Centaurea solstitialis]